MAIHDVECPPQVTTPCDSFGSYFVFRELGVQAFHFCYVDRLTKLTSQAGVFVVFFRRTTLT